MTEKLNLVILILVIMFSCTFAPGRIYGMEGLNEARVRAVAAMLSEQPKGFGAPASDRAAWKKLAAKDSFRRVIADAEKLLRTPIPEQSDDLYLDYSRTGNRTRWQRVSGRRRGRIGTLVLAECLENKGRFVRPFEETARALCSERTWVMPAHDRGLANFNAKTVDIDLGSSMLAWNLATADYLLGEKLGRDSRLMIRDNLERRIFKPYEDMVAGKRSRNWWMTTTNNWNAVCLGGGCTPDPGNAGRLSRRLASGKYSRQFSDTRFTQCFCRYSGLYCADMDTGSQIQAGSVYLCNGI